MSWTITITWANLVGVIYGIIFAIAADIAIDEYRAMGLKKAVSMGTVVFCMFAIPYTLIVLAIVGLLSLV